MLNKVVNKMENIHFFVIFGIMSILMMHWQYYQILKLERKLIIYKGDEQIMNKYIICIKRKEVMTIKTNSKKEAIEIADVKVPEWTHITR